MRIALPALLALGACDYSAPEMEDFPTPLNVIAGTVAADGVEDPTHTILFVTDAANPGPPAGTGSPQTFTTVPGSLFTDPSAAGLSGAPWEITNVPDGRWLVSGFMDRDNDFFFSTAISTLAGATCGDVIGAHVASVETQELAAVEVSGGELVDDVTVALAVELTTERPAFTLGEEAIDGSAGNGSNISIATALDAGVLFPQQFRLNATGLHADISSLSTLPGPYEYHLDGPFDPTAPLPCQTAFLGRVVDANLDGAPDEPAGLEGNGLLDMWPRIFLQYLGDTPEGESWAGQAFVSPFMLGDYTGRTDGIDNDGDGAVDEAQDIPLNTPVYLPSIAVAWAPAALKITVDAEGNETQELVLDPSQIPLGEWAITVVEESGQTWTIPNQLAGFPATADAGDYDPALQAATLIIEE